MQLRPWAGLVLVASGCVPVLETNRTDDKPLREYATNTVSARDQYRVEVDAKPSEDRDTLRLEMKVLGFRTCTTTRHKVVDRTEIAERRWGNDLRLTAYTTGIIGTGLLSWGVWSRTHPSSKSSAGDLALGVGAVASLFLVEAIVTDLRAMDSRNHVGKVDIPAPVQTTCREKALPRAQVSLRSPGGENLFAGTTDERGVVSADVPLADLLRLGAAYSVQLTLPSGEGVDVGSTDVLAHVYANATKEEQDRRRRLANEAAAQEERSTSESEMRAGRCQPDRHARLQQALQGMKNLFEGLRDVGNEPDLFRLEAHQIIVASTEGAPLQFSTLLGGELHVFLLGFGPVELDMTDADGNPVAMQSPYRLLISNIGDQLDTRFLQANSRDAFTVRAKGRGCVLIAAFRKY